MTPQALDKYLEDFGDNVSMRRKGGGTTMVPVDKLREYIKRAIRIAVDESKGGDK